MPIKIFLCLKIEMISIGLRILNKHIFFIVIIKKNILNCCLLYYMLFGNYFSMRPLVVLFSTEKKIVAF